MCCWNLPFIFLSVFSHFYVQAWSHDQLPERDGSDSHTVLLKVFPFSYFLTSYFRFSSLFQTCFQAGVMFEAQRSEAFPPSQLTCESHRNIHAVWPRHVSAVCSHSESDLWELVFNDNSAEAGFLLLCQRRSFIQNDAEIKSVNFYSNKN